MRKAPLLFAAILVLYIAYLVYTGQKVPMTKQETIRHMNVKIDEIKSGGQKNRRGGR